MGGVSPTVGVCIDVVGGNVGGWVGVPPDVGVCMKVIWRDLNLAGIN